MSTRSPETLIQFPLRSTAELQAEASDKILLTNSLSWVEHFAEFANKDTATDIYRRLVKLCGKLERERGFGKK